MSPLIDTYLVYNEQKKCKPVMFEPKDSQSCCLGSTFVCMIGVLFVYEGGVMMHKVPTLIRPEQSQVIFLDDYTC